MAFGETIDGGGRNRTIIIVSIVLGVLLLLGVGGFVLWQRSHSGAVEATAPGATTQGTAGGANAVPKEPVVLETGDPSKVSGPPEDANAPQQPKTGTEAPFKANENRPLTDDEKTAYGYPVAWQVNVTTDGNGYPSFTVTSQPEVQQSAGDACRGDCAGVQAKCLKSASGDKASVATCDADAQSCASRCPQ